jgi:pSer/pThr/pTyr-binding forkhead associated (FHA) protein
MSGARKDASQPAENWLVEDTRLESVEDIRQATAAEAGAQETVTFRPVRRPPLALLGILDDGREDGEWVRLRGDRLVIGRNEGDVVIPHDGMMSARHAELKREMTSSGAHWVLTDLQSTNGTFVRVNRTVLKHGQELILGGSRYRFDFPAAVQSAPAPAPSEQPPTTQGWQAVSATDLLPSLVEVLPGGGAGQRFFLNQQDHYLGRSAAYASVVVERDLLLSPRHARIRRDSRNRWLLENAGSRNGIWLRISHLTLDASCQFQLGEQRFLFKLL